MRFVPPHDIETFTRSPYRVSWIYPAPHLNAYVENVLTDRFAEWFRKDSRWIEPTRLDGSPSFFMMLRRVGAT